MIEVSDISKRFGSHQALESVSFRVGDGEIVGLLGPNGAGKSTTMRIMTGFLTPDTGDVTINGVSVLASPTLAQNHIGYLPENNPLYKDMLVSDYLEYSAHLKAIPSEHWRELFDFAVHHVGIEDVFFRPIRELSKGYKQRVGLAASLLNKPDILILDEPSEGLDPNQRTEIRSLIRSLATHQTVIVSTHVLGEVEAVCDRLIILNKGRIVADGSIAQLLKKRGTHEVLTVELEGKNIEKGLKALEKFVHIATQKGKGGRLIVHLTPQTKTPVQPELSRIAAENDWVIWKLESEETHLESLFQELTRTEV